MSGIQLESEQVAADRQAFTDFASTRGYNPVGEYGLTEGPHGLTIVNSTIAPYVERIFTADGTIDVDDALTQTCVRLRGLGNRLGDIATHSMFLTSFAMGGNITNCRAIDEVTADFIEYMTSTHPIRIADIHATYHSGQAAQLGALRGAGISKSAIEAVGENSHVWVDWQFGTPGPTGTGITILLEGTQGDLEQVGNVIHIDKRLHAASEDYEHLPRAFTEVGFGIERLRMCAEEMTDVFEQSPYQEVIIALKDLSSAPTATSEAMFRGISDVIVGLHTLIGKEVFPGPKGNGSVVRKLIRHLFVASEEAHLDKDALILLFPTDSVREVVEAEFKKFDSLVVSAPAIIRRYLKKNPALSHQEALSSIHSTHGIPVEIVERYLPA